MPTFASGIAPARRPDERGRSDRQQQRCDARLLKESHGISPHSFRFRSRRDRSRFLLATTLSAAIILLESAHEKENPNMAQALTGGCLCGAVHYKVSGDRSSAEGATATIAARRAARGTTRCSQSPSSLCRSRASSPTSRSPAAAAAITRRFCPVCGSRIASVATVMPGMLLITASTLDDPEKFVSQMSAFASRAPSWIVRPRARYHSPRCRRRKAERRGFRYSNRAVSDGIRSARDSTAYAAFIRTVSLRRRYARRPPRRQPAAGEHDGREHGHGGGDDEGSRPKACSSDSASGRVQAPQQGRSRHRSPPSFPLASAHRAQPARAAPSAEPQTDLARALRDVVRQNAI